MRYPWLAALAAALSEAGFGLLLWLGLSVALVSHSAQMPVLRAMQLGAVVLALGLLAVAAGAAFASAQTRGVRALLRAPTRWQARRNVLALLALLLTGMTGVLLAWVAPGATRASLLGMGGLVLAMASLGAVAFDALAQAPTAGDGARQFALPVRLLSAMHGGLALTFALMAGLLAVKGEGRGMLAILAVLGVLLLLASILDWREADRARSGGVVGGSAPANGLRIATGVLLAGVPLLALGAVSALGGVQGWLWIVALAGLAGILLERRLHVAAAVPVPALA